MTYPEIGEFLQTHVVGTTPINYEEYFEMAGLTITEVETEVTVFFRDQQTPFINVNQSTGEFYFMDTGLNSTLIELGVQPGDIIKSVNGVELNLQNARTFIGQTFQWTPDTDLTMEVVRDGEEIEVSGKVGNHTAMSMKLVEMEDASSDQIQLRNWWLGDGEM